MQPTPAWTQEGRVLVLQKHFLQIWPRESTGIASNQFKKYYRSAAVQQTITDILAHGESRLASLGLPWHLWSEPDGPDGRVREIGAKVIAEKIMEQHMGSD